TPLMMPSTRAIQLAQCIPVTVKLTCAEPALADAVAVVKWVINPSSPELILFDPCCQHRHQLNCSAQEIIDGRGSRRLAGRQRLFVPIDVELFADILKDRS